MALLDPHLAAVLVCPLCHGQLQSEEDASQLRCLACGRTYPVRDFPIMMPESVAQNENIATESDISDAEAD